jgi:hypothetical protein
MLAALLACQPDAHRARPTSGAPAATVTIPPGETPGPTMTAEAAKAGMPSHRLPISCGRETCAADKPFCCWDYPNQRGSCTAYEECNFVPERRIAVSECSKPADCKGGVPCCFAPPRAALCADSPWMSRSPGMPVGCGYGAFCETVADCPKTISGYGEVTLLGCETGVEDAVGLPGSKGCKYKW